MANFQKNNLDKASSPYLQQHKDNPIFWQEWNEETINYAKKNNRILFVSVGYATCHWCHVMAEEVFSNDEIAKYLNQHIVAIKVDREQRPDIDQYLMNFLIATQGSGGWPLNVFLTPEQKPIAAFTYLPLQPKFGLPTFFEVAKSMQNAFHAHKERISSFTLPIIKKQTVKDAEIIKAIKQEFDEDFAGFGTQQKFPPHSTLLFLLSYQEEFKDETSKQMIEKTLDRMALSGLHDHLQGGFFRYCVDRYWTIPHFEKMLYDQAMLLWIYSTAYKILKKESYKKVAEKIMKCLADTFEEHGLYVAAHDADTDHHEGATYVWSIKELKAVLSDYEFQQLASVYDLQDEGNFEGKNHLIKKKQNDLSLIEKKLLDERKKRQQPFTDRKILTSWNCLVGIAFMHAYRCVNSSTAKQKAINLFTALVEKHFKNKKLSHSSLGNQLQEQEFLEDYASLLLLTTYIFEETGEHKELMEALFEKVNTFKKNGEWIESNNKDFQEVKANALDHPIPSSIALAEMAMLRTNILLDKPYSTDQLLAPLNYDFSNLSVLIKKGYWHIIHTPKIISWQKLPCNVIQVKGKEINDCYKGKCMPL